jgi:hypothetical protein
MKIYMRLSVVLLILFGVIACYGQTESKENDCIETWELNCQKAKDLTEIMALYPLQLEKTYQLERLLENTKVKNAFIIADYAKKLKRANRRKNINKVGIVISFFLGYLIAK